MKSPIKSLSNVIAACALLLFAVPSQGQNICDALFSIADLANSGQKLELKVDITDPVSGCTIQVDVEIDKEDVTQEKLDFKIDRSCPEGQAQLLGLTLDLSGATACSIKYDNPGDPTIVNNNTDISTVPGLQQLFQDALDATEAQFPGDPLALVLALIVEPPVPVCPCDIADLPTVAPFAAQITPPICNFDANGDGMLRYRANFGDIQIRIQTLTNPTTRRRCNLGSFGGPSALVDPITDAQALDCRDAVEAVVPDISATIVCTFN